ncbi:MAG: glycosyltransferase family 39 protein [Chloroflexi bacterium]|nr:glycosyltransferase family 39 protein [Chloroflexota bacterium]
MVQAIPHADVAIASGLVAIALAARWPELLTSPPYPSAGVPILKALALAEGRATPLVDQSPYLGPLFIYLLALAFKLGGASVQTVLLVPWLIGSLTVLPVYLLGRETRGRLVGALAAGLLATSGAHAVIASHVPWVHSLTPLFAACTLWLLARAVRRGDGRSLALAGLVAGVSLQTHPTVAPLLVGAGLAAVLQCRTTVPRRWLAVSAALLLVGYQPLLVNHIRTSFSVVGDVESKQARYLDADIDRNDDPHSGFYLNNLRHLAMSLGEMTSGSISSDDFSLDDPVEPLELVYPLLGILGLVIAARRGHPLLLLAVLPAVLLPPLLNGKYKPILDGRYLMPLLPVFFLGLALAGDAALRATRQVRRRLGRGLTVLVAVAMLVLTLHPLRALAAFYDNARDQGETNSLSLRTLERVQAARYGGEPVLLDARLWSVKAVGGGNAGATFTWLLAVSGIPTSIWSSDEASALAGQLVILQRDTADELDGVLDLSSLDGRRQRGRDRESYRAYRVGPADTLAGAR